MINILYIASYENVRFKGGIYTIAAKVIAHADAFLESGVRFSFLSSCQITRKLSKVGRLSLQNIRNAILLRARIREQLIASSIEIVYINTSNSIAFLKDVWLCKGIKKRSDVKTVLHVHYSDIDKILPANLLLKTICISWINKYVDHVVVLNGYTQKQFKTKFGDLSTSVIPNFSTVEFGYEKRSSIDELKLLYLGTIDSRKGFDKCIKIALELINRKISFKLTVAGDWLNEDFKSNMLTEISKLKLSEYINFKGFVSASEKEQLLRQSDCLLLLSQNEGMSMALLEAMSSGLAILASDIPAHHDVFFNTGINLFTLEDIHEVVQRLENYAQDTKALESDQKLCYELSHQYTFNNFADRTVAAIKSL